MSLTIPLDHADDRSVCNGGLVVTSDVLMIAHRHAIVDANAIFSSKSLLSAYIILSLGAGELTTLPALLRILRLPANPEQA